MITKKKYCFTKLGIKSNFFPFYQILGLANISTIQLFVLQYKSNNFSAFQFKWRGNKYSSVIHPNDDSKKSLLLLHFYFDLEIIPTMEFQFTKTVQVESDIITNNCIFLIEKHQQIKFLFVEEFFIFLSVIISLSHFLQDLINKFFNSRIAREAVFITVVEKCKNDFMTKIIINIFI
ncbi:hypothetical protein RFI_02569 [Reticulomyxa filosa]|uniref:Transmembrane protein n=1 Tax=Reticulomyxa filosa TaxID=46433 RepID=X6P8T3_RETFI|nr:hypothetical protein RFI_02569 [Reticulomyxa filosa]|eukprot:ETO34523.1 hypothetical protein RFI_02569 [Reticulomyxa filosa]